MKTMTLAQYVQMWQWINEWQKANQTQNLPNHVSISSFGIEGINQIEKSVFMDMYNRVQKFQESHDGKMPEIIGIEGSATGTEPPTTTSGSIKSRLEAGLGKFNNFTEFWQKILGRGYSYYYNDVYTLDQEINRLLNKQGLNCTDSMQLCHALGTEMGYEVKYVHVMCKQGGHIRGQIRGHEFKNWTKIDPAAALNIKSKAPLGVVWCDYPNAHIEDSAWLNIDDGH